MGLVCGAAARAGGPPGAEVKDYESSVRPVFTEYCLKCHSAEKHKGDMNLEQFKSLEDVTRQPKVWQAVLEQLSSGEMPPEEKPQPAAVQRERLVTWVRGELKEMAKARAGDPGPVVLRRLSNAEYTQTLRDLTGVESLSPAREFPVDGAAGEGFMNTGNALVMSPALLTKYFDAGKEIASHAILLPDGIRFSSKNTRRDWTDELLAEIKGFYARYADGEGKIPLTEYLAATLDTREAWTAGTTTPGQTARERGLNEKYLSLVWRTLKGTEPSLALDRVRAKWRAARPGDAAGLAEEIDRWQKALWRFQNVGHIKPWMVTADPVTGQQEERLKITAPPGAKEVTLYLAASAVGGENTNDFVEWRRPRLVIPGRLDLPLREARAAIRERAGLRDRVFSSAARCLEAAAEAGAEGGQADTADLARRHGVDKDALAAWLNYLGVGAAGPKITSYFTTKIEKAGNFDFIKGWGSSETPLLLANSSDTAERIPGNMKPHSVAVHPSPTLRAAVGWRSPVSGLARIEGRVARAHPECGPGVTWSLELRRGATRQRLAGGVAGGSDDLKVGPLDKVPVWEGDLVSVLIGPRNGDHACGLTAVELSVTVSSEGAEPREWNLAKDVSGDVLAGNPHADRFGHARVWQFYTEPDKGENGLGPVIPPGSILARWQLAPTKEEKTKLAEETRALLTNPASAAKGSADEALYRQLASLGGPLFDGAAGIPAAKKEEGFVSGAKKAGAEEWGLDPALFGRHPDGQAIDAESLCVQAPSVVEVRLPADLVEGCELVVSGVLEPRTGAEGSVQLQLQASKPEPGGGARPERPILANAASARGKKIEAAFEEFRQCFPAMLCYRRIVPVDEVITLQQFHRDDEPLCRLMLDEAQKAKLDRYWEDLHYISRDALTTVDSYGQLMEYATQDSDPRIFEHLRKPLNEGAAAYRQALTNNEPRQIQAALEFAARAYRRPLSDLEKGELRDLYHRLREEELPHEEALRLTLARTLVAPAFLYKIENPGPGKTAAPVSDWEMASRLSYFLWSTMPDEPLRQAAAAGALRTPEGIGAQVRRMLRDRRTRRLATEFACQWLHIHDFDELDEKSEKTFPTFVGLRGAMYEESIRFFTDLFQRDGSIREILGADHTFLNEALAKHYGIPDVQGEEWRRVDGMRKYSRGGILGLGATLAKQSGASRTSPILRGNWVCEALLGEKLPRPPKDVPKLPEDESGMEGLTVRQTVEKHTSDPKCARCHQRMDPYGYALEGFDAIGRFRERDSGGRAVDTKVKSPDGVEFAGLAGLRDYLLNQRGETFERQFCKKLLGYALGRATMLSDEPLLDEMLAGLKADDYHVGKAVEMVAGSRQFREIRGIEAAYDE
jgi:hypothetical protein